MLWMNISMVLPKGCIFASEDISSAVMMGWLLADFPLHRAAHLLS